MHTHQKSSGPVATIGLDIGKNTFHLVGLDKPGAIAMRIKLRRMIARSLGGKIRGAFVNGAYEQGSSMS